MSNLVWIIGSGYMGREYAKVLSAMGIDYIVIGRGEENAVKLETEIKHSVIRGGIEKYLEIKPEIPSRVIITTKVESLAETTKIILRYGVKDVLLEKPGVSDPKEIDELCDEVKTHNANVVLAYNRRFYSSILKAEEIIESDGGVSSFNFEFTEWVHLFNPNNYAKETLEYLVLGNSSHVIDTAFFLCGKPKEMICFKGGEKEIEWHPSGSKYVGAGISENGALFSYQANWNAPGRWVVEILTPKHRLYLKPMESLQIQEKESVVVTHVDIDNKLDIDFKPGLYLQTKAFLENDYRRFCTIENQKEHIKNIYLKMTYYAE